MKNYIHSDLSHAIIKAYYEVYNELGTGFLESVYENAMMEVLTGYGLKVEKQFPIEVCFREKVVGNFKADLIIEDRILVELKAAGHIHSKYKAQIINYLKATNIEIGLLMNFGEEPEFKRYIFNKK
jgi:GxxExxY protein